MSGVDKGYHSHGDTLAHQWYPTERETRKTDRQTEAESQFYHDWYALPSAYFAKTCICLLTSVFSMSPLFLFLISDTNTPKIYKYFVKRYYGDVFFLFVRKPEYFHKIYIKIWIMCCFSSILRPSLLICKQFIIF